MPRAILFDFNGVIVDDEAHHCDALIATLAEYGYSLSREAYYREYLGVDDRACFRFTFERIGHRAEADALQAAIERKATFYQAGIQGNLRLVPGATEFIHLALEAGYRLAIVSGARRREIEWILRECGLRDAFAVVLASEDVALSKPDPLGYRMALRAVGVSAERGVAIEDSLPGLAAARGAGLPCVMITTSLPVLAGDGGLSLEHPTTNLVWSDFAGRSPTDLPWRDA